MTGPVTGADRPGRMRRGAARFAVLLVVCLGAGLGLAGPAAAHNVLIASDPADGAVLQQSPTVISLTFDQPVQDFQPVVTVLGADGQRYESGTPSGRQHGGDPVGHHADRTWSVLDRLPGGLRGRASGAG